ncbi:MAG: DEAD/DEAH box helicase [Glaciecola sp.]|jgi:superfamily II DNA/RNA helicase
MLLTFSDLNLDHRIVTTLTNKHFTEPTPVQANTIPYAMIGRDILCCSKTGSGKTFAFVLPIIHRLMNQKSFAKRDARALILAPTRELAKQVYLEVRALVSALPLKAQLVVGGENFNDQVKALRHNPQIIVGTAGRVADHLSGRTVFLNGLEILVYDEADRMLDLGFAKQLLEINQAADHRKRQTMLFSATLDSPSLTHLTDTLLKQPEKIMLDSSFTIHSDITQQWYFADHIEHKHALLAAILNEVEHNQAIVFCATREDTVRLKDLLNEANLDAIALSGDLLQNQRAHVMSSFISGQHSVLVTTDVASRGLDMKKVSLVVNFDLPKLAEEYVHRIGRTGRAGAKGLAIALVGPRDWTAFTHIQRNVGSDITIESYPQLPAKFIGYKLQNTASNNTSAPKKKVKKSITKVSKKRIDTTQGVEMGHVMIKRKPRNDIILNDDTTEDGED